MKYVIGVIFCCFLIPIHSYSFMTLRSSLSSGFYRDIESETHTPAYFSWLYSQVLPNGMEAMADIGFNNNVYQDSWRFFIYQGTLSFPISSVRITAGRQMYFESFDVNLLDGAQLSWNWSPTGGIWLVGGGLHLPEPKQIRLDSQLYGGSIHEDILGATVKLGYFFNNRDPKSLHLGYTAITKTWEDWFLKPMLLAKSQWDLNQGNFDQGLAEAYISPWDFLQMGGGISSVDRHHILTGQGEEIFHLFSLSEQISRFGSMTFYLSPELQLQGIIKNVGYKSPAQNQWARQEQISLGWTTRSGTGIQLPFSHAHSYGGDVWRGGITLTQSLTRWSKLRIDTDMARIDKINDISGFAYHGRSGFDFRAGRYILFSILGEVEQNHFFEFDARTMVYASHYFYD